MAMGAYCGCGGGALGLTCHGAVVPAAGTGPGVPPSSDGAAGTGALFGSTCHWKPPWDRGGAGPDPVPSTDCGAGAGAVFGSTCH